MNVLIPPSQHLSGTIESIHSQTIPNIDYIGSEGIIQPTPYKTWSPFAWLMALILIIILTALGINLFTYLANGTDYIGDIIQNLSDKLPEKGKKIINNNVSGVNVAIDMASGVAKSAAAATEAATTTVFRGLDIKRSSLWDERDKGVEQDTNDRRIPGKNKKPVRQSRYKESSAGNNIQEKHKRGYCYIGNDRGHRSCIKVDSGDECESSKIFQTMDTCKNPSLRE